MGIPVAPVAAFLARTVQESRKANGMDTTHFGVDVVKCSTWNWQHFCIRKDRWVSHRIVVNCTDNKDTRYLFTKSHRMQ